MKTKLVADMREVNFRDAKLVSQGNGFGYIEVRNMFCMSQCIDDHYFAPLDFIFLCFFYAVCICNVCEASKSKSEHRHIQMPDPNWNYRNVSHHKCIGFNQLKIDVRNAG